MSIRLSRQRLGPPFPLVRPAITRRCSNSGRVEKLDRRVPLDGNNSCCARAESSLRRGSLGSNRACRPTTAVGLYIRRKHKLLGSRQGQCQSGCAVLGINRRRTVNISYQVEVMPLPCARRVAVPVATTTAKIFCAFDLARP